MGEVDRRRLPNGIVPRPGAVVKRFLPTTTSAVIHVYILVTGFPIVSDLAQTVTLAQHVSPPDTILLVPLTPLGRLSGPPPQQLVHQRQARLAVKCRRSP